MNYKLFYFQIIYFIRIIYIEFHIYLIIYTIYYNYVYNLFLIIKYLFNYTVKVNH